MPPSPSRPSASRPPVVRVPLPPPSIPPVESTTGRGTEPRQGEELAEITNGIVGLFSEYDGRGPTRGGPVCVGAARATPRSAVGRSSVAAPGRHRSLRRSASRERPTGVGTGAPVKTRLWTLSEPWTRSARAHRSLENHRTVFHSAHEAFFFTYRMGTFLLR